MHRFDVCNGDADGLCAVLQWRLHEPAPATLVTGLKRDIELLARVDAAAGDEVLVCDVSMERNRAALLALLGRGVRVRWFDHHEAGEVPRHPNLQATLGAGAAVCTSLLVDRALQGAHRAWALVGAYGDNLGPQADALAATLGLEPAQREALRRLGEAINYNAYGEQESDVRVPPAQLYAMLARWRDPLAFVAHEPLAAELDALRAADLARARAVAPHRQDARGSVVLLPDEPWARRVVGTLAYDLANREPGRAHAVLWPGPRGTWRVSVRAPLAAPDGALALCRQFGGSGRAAAGGIDRLEARDLDRFLAAFAAAPWGRPAA